MISCDAQAEVSLQMCFARPTLLYGLWISTSSLAWAAVAHHHTRAQFLAIDLLLHRRRAGNLVVEGKATGSSFGKLPEEVWALVKGELLLVEADAAEAAEMDKHRCDYCTVSSAPQQDVADSQMTFLRPPRRTAPLSGSAGSPLLSCATTASNAL